MNGIPPAQEMPAVASNVPALPRFRIEALRNAGVAIGCIGLFIIFSALTSNFYSPSNLLEIILQSSINAILAVGMTLVVMCKGIDLSVGSIVGLSSMITASVLPSGLPLAIFAGLVIGVGCGLLNGIVIAKLKMPDFIVTLGAMSIYRGAALIFSSGQPIYQIADDFRAIFSGTVAGIPTPVIIAVVFAVLAYLLVRFTTLGEHIIAVGGNEEAARLSGVAVDRVKITVYALSGFCSAVAGFVLVARIGAAEPIGGTGFELQAIGASVIGGASLFGGEGNPIGSLVGALTLAALQNGLTLLNVQSFWQYVASGLVVILAVFADQVTRRRR